MAEKRYRVAVRQGGSQGVGIGIEHYCDQETLSLWSMYLPERMTLINAYMLAVDVIAKEAAEAQAQAFIKIYHRRIARILHNRYDHPRIAQITNMQRKRDATVMGLAADALRRKSTIYEKL